MDHVPIRFLSIYTKKKKKEKKISKLPHIQNVVSSTCLNSLKIMTEILD